MEAAELVVDSNLAVVSAKAGECEVDLTLVAVRWAVEELVEVQVLEAMAHFALKAVNL